MAEIRSTEQYHDGHQDGLEPVESLDLSKIHSFADMLDAYRHTSFGARQLGEALSILEEMASKYGVKVNRLDTAPFVEQLAALQDETAAELGTEELLARIRELR